MNTGTLQTDLSSANNTLDNGDLSGLVKMTKEGKKAMGEALQNCLILDNISHHLDAAELKSCRLVNHLWKSIASRTLLKRDCCTLVIEHVHWRACFLPHPLSADYNSPNVEIGAHELMCGLNKVLKNSPDFPCTHLTLHFDLDTAFDLEGDDGFHQWDPVQLSHLVIEDGELFKTIEFTSTHGPDYVNSADGLSEFLMQNFPNLETLSLDSISGSSWSSDSSSLEKYADKLFLPSLKHFSVNDSCREEIQSGAPNLKISTESDDDNDDENLDIENLQQLECSNLLKFWTQSSGKIEEIQEFQITSHPSTINFLPLLMSIEDGVHLKKLSFRRVKEFSPLFQKIVESSRDSLEYLNLGNLPILMNETNQKSVKIPKLANLHCLKLGSSPWQEVHGVLPFGINLGESFPNLHILNLTQLECHLDSNWLVHFPPSSICGYLPTVKILIIRPSCSEQWMKNILKICPNFKSLHVPQASSNLDKFLPALFKVWTHLEKIQIKFELPPRPTKPISLDCALTGVDELNCQRLRSTFPSICKKYLEYSPPAYLTDSRRREWSRNLRETMAFLRVKYAQKIIQIKTKMALPQTTGKRRQSRRVWRRRLEARERGVVRCRERRLVACLRTVEGGREGLNLEALECQPNICQLKDLKIFKLTTYHFNYKLVEALRNFYPFSYVTCYFAFRRMPGLKVSIETEHATDDENVGDLEEAFSSISSHVNFIRMEQQPVDEEED